jgi:argininosuccinate synthase
MSKDVCVLAYSGGLDTSFCIPFIREEYGYDIVTVMVDTGGFSPDDLKRANERATQLGVKEHLVIDGRKEVFDRYARYLIFGNVLRGGVYPLCVAAERVVQAAMVAEYALTIKAAAVAHGSTGAGNDQIRFDVAFGVLCPALKQLAPVREHSLSRQQETEYLAKHGLEIPAKTTQYSINAGMWGVTIGGKETHDSATEVPVSVFEMAVPSDANAKTQTLRITYEQGVPVALNGEKLDSVALVEKLNALSATYALGRGIHLGDTIVGIKGRIAFQAGAALMLIHAHRELEKLTLTKWQRFWKDHVADFYGNMIHEGQPFDPALRDIEAMLENSQQRVSGDVTLSIKHGGYFVTGATSPHSLMAAAHGKYGEEFTMWDGRDAAGYSKILSIPSKLYKGASKD